MTIDSARLRRFAVGAVARGALAGAAPAFADEAIVTQDGPPPPSSAANQASAPAQTAPAQPAAQPQAQDQADNGGGLELFSKNTITVMADLRLASTNGAKSFVNGGFGKTRFQGNAGGGYSTILQPVEADIVWTPRFGNALSANVSAAWQRGHDDGLDLMEAFLNYLPAQTGVVRLSGRVGLMWPEISQEHATGGAWSAVNTITPSAINSWVGEETKVMGAEATARTSLGEHDFAFTGGVFGWNDTSGTLLSFRGWALHDIKATGFGYFKLPPLNTFITRIQAAKTQSTVEIDHRPGFYARAEWRPPYPFGVALFYYDNEGDPEDFTKAKQWGWRTRFWNLGINANVAPGTKLLVQGMTGSTIMGVPNAAGQYWVHTDFQSAYALAVHDFGKFALTGRIESFQTREHGSQMSPLNSEDGWAATAAVRVPIDNHFTAFAEVMNVESKRGTRATLGGLSSPFESQMLFQIALRAKL
jgi:hypothetical protein